MLSGRALSDAVSRLALRARLSYVNVMATVAVFIALGGRAYAAVRLPADSVGTRQIRPHAVTRSRLADHSVTTAALAHDSVWLNRLSSGVLVAAAANLRSAALLRDGHDQP